MQWVNEKMQKQYKYSRGVPKNLLYATIDKYKTPTPVHKEIVDKIRKNIKESMLFYGIPGTGKSMLASAVFDEWMNTQEGMEGNSIWSDATEIMWDIRKSAKSDDMDITDRLESYTISNFVVIDDFGRQTFTEFEESVFFNIIKKRLEQEKQTIIITNMTAEGLKQDLDPALISRLFHHYVTVHFIVDDWREQNSKNEDGV